MEGEYRHGPTACMASPAVLKSIVREIKARRAVS